ncbi:sensor domain-containing diguanylate cyclase [Planococcus sp. FY231025]|uniref:sensor domain-containing diguanylate cyclase n=1 Tax=Planococcus sp. FY231025 TaxID=3455699 RepID=UPI003F8F4BF8
MLGPFTKMQLDMLYGKSDSLVYYMRRDGETYIYEYINPACIAVFGKDLTGETLDAIMPAHLATDIKGQYCIALDTDAPHVYRDYNLFSENNETNETLLTPIRSGSDVFMLAISKNVAKQKKVEEEYLFYQSLVQNSVDPMLMITSDLVIFDMNLAYSNSFGAAKEEWVGKPYSSLPFVDSRTFRQVEAELDSFKSGNAAKSMVIKRNKKDGTAATFSVNYSPIKEQGEVRAFHIVLRELTNEVQLKQELEKTEHILESYKDALNYAALVAIWDPAGTIQFVNDNFKGTTGYEREDLLGEHISKIGKAVISEEQYNAISQTVSSGKIWRGELKSLKKTGEFFWIDTTIIPLSERDGGAEQMLAVMFDITDRKELEEKLHFMAYHDSLTKLPNRLSIVKKFVEMKKEADAKGQQMAVVYMDGDDFKQVNDQYGHDVGDEFIYRFAQSIQDSIRKQDIVARVGGDEFIIALAGLDPAGAEEQIGYIVQRIRNGLAAGWEIDGIHFAPTATMGASTYPKQGQTLDELVTKADQALYLAKRNGKNSLLFYSDDLIENV